MKESTTSISLQETYLKYVLLGGGSAIFSVWYLFFAKGGNLFLYPMEVMTFF